jgi:hypothetical protein
MYLLNQDIANRIAITQQISSDLMRKWFLASEQEVREMEKNLENEVYQETGSTQISKAVTAYLPIAAENKAITEFIRVTRDYILRIQIPEIDSAKDAGPFAQLEFRMNHEQTQKTIQTIEHYLNNLKKDQLLPN